MINQKIIKILGNALQEKTITETNNFLLSKDLPWYFSQTSILDNVDSPTFWISKFNLLENKIILNLWSEIYTTLQSEQIIDNQNIEVLRVYANGQTYGLESSVHLDEVEPNHYTVLYYAVNDTWDTDWHGETIFYDDNEEQVIAVCQPKRNSFVFFDSRIPHVGMSPSKQYNGLRVTLAFKLRVN
tara:strand:- start:338 stop:892 length:555 start_codon:yes stop_codon:yes gene_type:complete